MRRKLEHDTSWTATVGRSIDITGTGSAIRTTYAAVISLVLDIQEFGIAAAFNKVSTGNTLAGLMVSHADDAVGRNIDRTLAAYQAEVAKGRFDQLAFVPVDAVPGLYSVGDGQSRINDALKAERERNAHLQALRTLVKGGLPAELARAITTAESGSKFSAKFTEDMRRLEATATRASEAERKCQAAQGQIAILRRSLATAEANANRLANAALDRGEAHHYPSKSGTPTEDGDSDLF